MMHIEDIIKFNEIQSSGKPSLIFFYAQWQDELMNGDLEDLMLALSSKYSNINFCSVEAESILELSETFKISVVPTFIAIRGQSVIGKVEGASPADLSKLTKLLSTSLPQPTAPGDVPGAVPSPPKGPDTESAIRDLVNKAPVMLFMKGSPSAPRCGFSRQISEILSSNKIPFASFDILTDESIRAGLKTFSDWPTFPQLYVSGDFVGGLDIIKELAAGGDLVKQLGIDKLQMPPSMPTVHERMVVLINQAPVMVFIKGSPDAPKCGFSRTIVGILREEKIEFSSFDILTDEEIRGGLKTFSDWPTYPQLYVKGDFMGGLDIIKEMQQSGSLRSQLGL